MTIEEAQSYIDNYCKKWGLKWEMNPTDHELTFYKPHVIHLAEVKDNKRQFTNNKKIDDGLEWARKKIIKCVSA
jgi:hypothetical protein